MYSISESGDPAFFSNEGYMLKIYLMLIARHKKIAPVALHDMHDAPVDFYVELNKIWHIHSTYYAKGLSARA